MERVLVSSNCDQIWCDVGGTFTDCFLVRPNGQRRYAKFLSSGTVKGTVDSWLTPSSFLDSTRRSDPDGFWIGAEVHWLDNHGNLIAKNQCVGFDPATGEVILNSPSIAEQIAEKISGPVRYELVSGLEAPVLAARWLLGTNLTDPLPALDVRLGTTRGTNALLTRTGERCAFVTTMGFADLVRIGYQERPDLFDLNVHKRMPLHDCVVEIEERLAADGSILVPLNEIAAEQSLRKIYDSGIRSIAVCFLHAYCNPVHEQHVEQIARGLGFSCVCISSRASPKIKAVLRSETALVDAYLTPIIAVYLTRVASQFGLNSDRRLRVMTSSGGLVAADLYRGKDSVLSGPAGGAVAIECLAQAMNEPRCIGLDMGGTSTDVCRIEGKLQLEHETIKAGVRMLVPTLAIHTVAAGGGSVCWFDGVALRVGPQSAGAEPGPACYGRGGPLTITDLNLLSHRIDKHTFPFQLDISAAEWRLHEVLDRLNANAGAKLQRFTAEQLIEGFRRIANEHMAAAVRSISIAQGADPRKHALVGFGGAAGQHICEIAELLGMNHAIDPPQAGLLSALGMGMATIKRTHTKSIYQPLQSIGRTLVEELQAQMREDAEVDFLSEGLTDDAFDALFQIELRYIGTDGTLMVQVGNAEENDGNFLERWALQFAELHQKRYGYQCPGKSIEAVAIQGEFVSKARNQQPQIQRVQPLVELAVPIRSASCPIYRREDLLPGQVIRGPALIVSSGSTTSLPATWAAHVLSDLTLSLDRETNTHTSLIADPSVVNSNSNSNTNTEQRIDPVLREVLTQRIAAIADQMGIVLEQTAVSVNVKVRRDFSCAVFAANGDLIANAPHVPVHLGAMSQTIRCMLSLFPAMMPGDCYVTNDPYQGGSHLPDITVVTPVFATTANSDATGSYSQRSPDFFVACRAHHAEVGGVSPGSMSPTSTRLGEEGVVIPPMHLVEQGIDRSVKVQQLLSDGKYPSRSVSENMADLSAQQAANQRGLHAMLELTELYGLDLVTQYLEHIQQASVEKTRVWINSLPEQVMRFEDAMDDGTRIVVSIQKAIDSDQQPLLRIDFEGTGLTSKGNLNANPAIVSAAVMYVIRCAVADSVPLNSGVLRCVELLIPVGILNPLCQGNRDDWPAVAGGNVETSQRIVDCLLGALGLAAASQGTMNNFLFGDASFGYYETIGGGTGATETDCGEDAVHSHMTNTRLTDVEVLEHQYPVRLVRFEIRKQSGGKGRTSGGNGLVRQVLALRPLDVSLVTSRRNTAPFGLAGGESGKPGENWLQLADGERIRLDSSVQLTIKVGDSILVETPGGGGFGPNVA